MKKKQKESKNLQTKTNHDILPCKHLPKAAITYMNFLIIFSKDNVWQDFNEVKLSMLRSC